MADFISVQPPYGEILSYNPPIGFIQAGVEEDKLLFIGEGQCIDILVASVAGAAQLV